MSTPAEFDPNVWYSISEARVDNATEPLGSTLQTTPGGLRVFGLIDRQWQMQPVDDEPGRYLMRYSGAGPGQQMAICYDPNEIANSRSVACMARSSTAENQKWDIVEWGDGTYRMHNAANGSSYALDVHPGSNLFMNNNIQGKNSDVYHIAQHWIWSSVKDVNEGAYSTIYSAPSTTERTEATTTTKSSATSTVLTTTTDVSSTATSGSEPANAGSDDDGGASTDNSNTSGGGGLSAGAAAGIGVAATLAVVGLALVGVFLWWKRRRTVGQYSKTSNVDDSSDAGPNMQSVPPSNYYSTPPPMPPHGGEEATNAAAVQYPPSLHQTQSQTQAQAHNLNRNPSVDGYYAPQDKGMASQDAVMSPQSAYGQGHMNQYAHEAPNQQIHEAPAYWHAELDAQGGAGGGRPGSGSGSGMNSVQNTPAVEFATMRH